MPNSRSRILHLLPLAAAQAVGLACGLASVRISSAIVPPDVLGIYGLLVSGHLLGAFVTHQGFIQHAQKSWTKETSIRAFSSLVLKSIGTPTLGLGIGLAALLILLKVGTGSALEWSWWIWLFVVNLLTFGAHLTQAILQAQERYWGYFVMSAVSSITRSFLPVGFVYLTHATLIALGAGFLSHVALWLASGLCLLAHQWRRNVLLGPETHDPPKGLLSTFAGVGICGWLAGNAPRWLAPFTLTPEITGYFMLAVNITTFVPAGISIIGFSYTFPPLFAAKRRGVPTCELLKMTTLNVIAVLTVGQFGLIALAWCGPSLVGSLVSPRYAPAMDWLLAAGGGTLATISSGFFCNFLVAVNRETECFHLTLLSGGFRILLLSIVTLLGRPDLFCLVLVVLAWPTATLEWWLARRISRDGSPRLPFQHSQ
jgi:hypothetical protein